MAATLLTPSVATRIRNQILDRHSSGSSSPRGPLDSSSLFEPPSTRGFSRFGRKPAATNPFVLRAAGALEEVGEGAYGEVHKGTDSASGRTKAFKFVQLTSDGRFFRSMREFQCLKQLSGCPNVLAVEGVEVDVRVDEDGDEVMEGCIVMPLCRGGDVHKYIHSRIEELDEDVEIGRMRKGSSKHCRQNGGLPEREAAALFAQMVRAVAACHQKGICHGDIKPENFLLTSRPQKVAGSEAAFVEPESVKLADFGLALDMSQSEERRREWVGGTPAFMAPEVVQCVVDDEFNESASVGVVADMWSLGATLYLMLSGRLPNMDAPKPFKPYAAAVAGGEVVLELKGAGWTGVSRQAKSLVRMLMSHDKAKRPTAAQVLGHQWLRPSRQPNSAHELKPKWRP